MAVAMATIWHISLLMASFFDFLFLFEIFAATEMSKKQQPEAQQRHSSTLRLNNIPRADDNEAETQPTSAGL